MHIVIYLRDQTPFQEGKNSAKEALKDTDWKLYLGKNVEDYKIAKKETEVIKISIEFDNKVNVWG